MAVPSTRRLVSIVFGALLCLAAGCARGYSLAPDEEPGAWSFDDPAVRILVGQPLPLSFALASQDNDWAPWPSALPRPLPLPGRFSETPSEPGVRLWLPVTAGERSRVRLTHAYVHLGQPAWNDADHRVVRPGAGFVMQLGRAPGHLQQVALGSVFRLDMGAGSQVSLRLRGGRLGVQYRLQFSL